MDEKVNILMVDDQLGKLLSYEAILRDLGGNLLKAESGSKALECLLKTDIAVILMDVNMPEQDGFELADMIRQHPRFRDIAIIFISGVHRTDADRLKGYELGAVDYISVPIIPQLLRAKVKLFVELHRKNRQLEALNRELRDLSGSMIMLQDDERRRVARELHDGLGQDLIAAQMGIEAVLRASQLAQAKERATEVRELISGVIKQVRNVSYLLHPPLLDEVGLQSALCSYVEGLTKRSGIQTFIEVQPSDFPRFAPDLEIAIFRIVQEALTNVFRHSGAQNARVTLRADATQVIVQVRDDGHGIPEHVAKFQPGCIGVGFGGMRQRIKEFGGELSLANANPGTLVEATIPIKVEASPPDFAIPTPSAREGVRPRSGS
jgi:signal transduction histidine kinase